jgi:glucokinase
MSTTVLAGDIGGTKTLLRLVDVQPPEPGRLVPRLETIAEASYPSRNHPDLVPIVREFLAQLPAGAAPSGPIAHACFGIAGPVIDGTSEVTNLGWSLSSARLSHELGVPGVTLLNDFTVIGCGLPALREDEVLTLQAGTPDPRAVIGVVGAGTGLGEGFLVPDEHGWPRPYPSEGGHADFAPRNAVEAELMAYLRRTQGLAHVAVEHVVSGPGIAAIYGFLLERDPDRQTLAMAAVVEVWRHEAGQAARTVDLSAAVSAAALAGTDPLSAEAMRIFLSAYGAEAGNFSLKLLCKGGLYLAGGVAPKILPLLENGTFMEAFCDRDRMRPLMDTLPVRVVLNPKIGLLGAALHAARTALGTRP